MSTQFMYSHPHNYGGQSHVGYDQSGFHGKNGGFAFRKRFERLDWRKIACVDVDQISRTLDFASLQENIMNITFCNIETELDVRMVDPNFVKLFRLAQLTIEYLLHSQDYLAGLVASNEEKAKKDKEGVNEVKQQVEKLQKELTDVKKESHKRKKLLMAQQQLIHAGSGSYNKCPYCPKAFLNSSFLHSHINRRHTDSIVPSKVSSPEQKAGSGSINRTLELELQEIKERLRMTESQLQEERKAVQIQQQKESQIVASTQRKVKAFRDLEPGEHEEIEKIKKAFMREIKEVNEKYMASERALVEMEQKFGKRSHLSEIQDDIEIEKELLHQQRENVAVMKEKLQEQVQNFDSQMKTRFEKQEKKWQKKVQQMTRQHADELRKLNDALEHTSRELSTNKQATTPEARQQQQQVQQLLRKSREQEKLLETREEMLEKEVQKPITSPVSSLIAPKYHQRAESPAKMLSMVPSDEDDDSTALGTGTNTGSLRTTGKGTLGSTLGTSIGEPTLKTTQFLEQLRKNPSLRIMHDEFSAVLDENIIRRGIPAGQNGISDQVLRNKLEMEKTQRRSLVQKFPDFLHLREYYDRIAEEQAREKLRLQKRSPPPPARGSHAPTPSSTMESHAHPASRGQILQATPPKPAPRSTTPQRTLQSTGSTTEWTSTNWDSEDEEFSDEYDARMKKGQPIALSPAKTAPSPQTRHIRSSDNIAPSPQPRGQPIQIKSKPLNDFDDDDDDWNDSESDFQPNPPKQGVSQPIQPRIIMSQPKGQKVSELSRSIELQLSGRSKANKPFGGVDTVSKKKKSSDVLEDFDEESDWDTTGEAEPAKINSRRPGTRGSHAETDFSTNTYGTSVWGSSSKGVSSVKPENRGSSRSSFVSVTDVSSDEELDLENI